MTVKTSFTKEEWATMVKAPFYAGSAIGAADIHGRDQGKEREAMVKETTLWVIPDVAKDLIRPLYSDIGKFREDTDNLPGYTEEVDPASWKPTALQGLRDIMAILNAKATEEEMAAFREWLMYVAEKTAEAGREGAMGLVGPRVSDKEKEALADVSQALGVSA